MPQESLFQTVSRHVRESEERVARQRDIVEAKRRANEPMGMSAALLETFEASLELHTAHLRRLLNALP